MAEQAILRKNTFIGLFAVLIWSFAAILAVELTSIPPFQLLFSQFLVGFSIVIVRYYKSDERKTFTNFRKTDIIIASIALVCNQLFYFTAFRYSPAAQVDLINYLWPTLLLLFTSFLPKEKLCPSYFVACLICVFGVYTLFPPDAMQTISSEHIFGYFLAFGAALTWALYSLYTRYRGSSNSANCISWATGPAALVTLLAHITFEKTVIPNLYEVMMILLFGVFQTGLGFYFWDRGLKKGCVKVLSLSSYAIPILSILILVLFGKTAFEPRMITAAIIISLSPLFPLLTEKFKGLKLSKPKPSLKPNAA